MDIVELYLIFKGGIKLLFERISNRINTVISVFCFRRKGAKIGRRMWIHGKAPLLFCGGAIHLGDRVNFRADSVRSMLTARNRGKITLGDRVFLNNGVEIHSELLVVVGDHTRIGPYCSISDTNFHAIDEGDAAKVKAVKIGRNVWLGRNVIVLPGVTIGDNSVIGAGSVVTGTIPDNEVWAGNPARKVKDVNASPSFVRK